MLWGKGDEWGVMVEEGVNDFEGGGFGGGRCGNEEGKSGLVKIEIEMVKGFLWGEEFGEMGKLND